MAQNFIVALFLCFASTSLFALVNVIFPANPIDALAPIARGFPVSCGVYQETLTGKSKELTSAPQAEMEYCDFLKDRAHRNKTGERWKHAYDTFRVYIDSCHYEEDSWRQFGPLSVSAGDLAEGKQDPVLLEFREWIKRVMYLNTINPNYYCAAVNALFTTFNYETDERGFDINGMLAIYNHLIQTNKCPDWTEEYNRLFTFWRDQQRDIYLDTMHPGSPELDTTLPSLEELGLEFLLSPPKTVEPLVLNSLAAVRVQENPFRDENELLFELASPAYISISIYDGLGRRVWGTSDPSFFDRGSHSRIFSLPENSAGAYYLRMEQIGGGVKTVKIQKVN